MAYDADPACALSDIGKADALHVGVASIYRWRNRLGYWDEVERLIETRVGLRHLAPVWRTLAAKAVEGNVEALKLYFRKLRRLPAEQIEVPGGVILQHRIPAIDEADDADD